MKSIAAIACAALLCSNACKAQEISAASYAGALEGAAQACVAAFPEKAQVYRESLYRSVKCHMSPVEFAHWYKELRHAAPFKAQYEQGYATGKASLSQAGGTRSEQCRSLELLMCDPKSPPRNTP